MYTVLLCIACVVVSATALLPSGVIFPLFVSPGDGCAGWASVISGISIDSIIPFYIVVNPSNGPGHKGSQPNAIFQTCITNLKAAGTAAGNVKVLGFVATGHGVRAKAKVLRDIETYSGWTPACRPDGIFFDEAAADPAHLPLYEKYVFRVHRDFGTSFVALNPGTAPAAGYFDIADLIITLIDFSSNFSASKLTISPTSPAHKQAVILHDDHSLNSFGIVDQLAAIIGVGASFVTDLPLADAFSHVSSGYNSFLGNVIAAQTA